MGSQKEIKLHVLKGHTDNTHIKISMIKVHPSSYVDEGARVGDGTVIWHFCHVQSTAVIGRDCSLGQNVNVAGTVGDRCRIQNNVSVYQGVTLEDGVFCGPSCVFTNVSIPRAEHSVHGQYAPTLIRRGASLGANCTVVCGHTVGRWAMIAAGAVVTCDVPDYALMAGVPARQIGWVDREGNRVPFCPESAETAPASSVEAAAPRESETVASREAENPDPCMAEASNTRE